MLTYFGDLVDIVRYFYREHWDVGKAYLAMASLTLLISWALFWPVWLIVEVKWRRK